MSGKLVCSIYCILFLFLLSSPTHAMELILDERIPMSSASSQSSSTLKNTDISVNRIGVFSPREIKDALIAAKKAPSFHFWWLLLLPAVLLTMFLGWLIGYYSNQRRASKKVSGRRSTDKNNFSLTKKTASRKERLRKLKRRQAEHKKQLSADDVFDFSDLNKAYNCHRFGRHDDMMDIMQKAFKHDPFDLNVYILAMTILSESDEPSLELTRLLKTGLFLLRIKRPFVWQEVAEKGRDLVPDLEDWSWTPA